MASGLRAHLHRHYLHDSGLKMPKVIMHLDNTHIQMTQKGTSRHRPECGAAWCNGEDDDADQHVHMTAQKHEMSHISFSSGNLNSKMHNADTLSNDVTHTSVILACSKPFPKHSRHHMHHRLMKQTQYKLQIVFNKHCLHTTSTGEADRHHLFDAEVLRVAGHLGTAGSACPHVLPSTKTGRHQPNALLSVCHSQLH